jgi:hypothetical protein
MEQLPCGGNSIGNIHHLRKAGHYHDWTIWARADCGVAWGCGLHLQWQSKAVGRLPGLW